MKNVAITPSKSYTSWRKRTRSRHEKRRLYVVKNATCRDGNGHDRGMKTSLLRRKKDTRRDGNRHDRGMKTSLTRRQKTTRRGGNGHDRGLKNVTYMSSKTRHVVTETDTIKG